MDILGPIFAADEVRTDDYKNEKNIQQLRFLALAVASTTHVSKTRILRCTVPSEAAPALAAALAADEVRQGEYIIRVRAFNTDAE